MATAREVDMYTADDIQVLEGMEAVRKRPGMYIGSTDQRGLHHLVYEIVDNCVDEFMAGFASGVSVHILPDGMVRIEDDGRGIPVDVHATTGMTAVETVMTTLHAGGKFGGKAYAVSGGLHGVGASVVNALSESLEVEVSRDGTLYRQTFSRGRGQSELTSEPLPRGSKPQDRHRRLVHARHPDIRGLRLRLRCAAPALQGNGISQQGLGNHLPQRLARTRKPLAQQRSNLLLRGRHFQFRPQPQPEARRSPRRPYLCGKAGR